MEVEASPAEIPNNHLGCTNPCKYWDKLPTLTGINYQPAEVGVCVVHFSEFSTSSVLRIRRLSLPAHAVSSAIRATGAAHGVGDVIVNRRREKT